MRVGILKPDHGGIGGFERLLARTAQRLRDRGIDVVVRTFDAHTRPDVVQGLSVRGGIRDVHDDYFLYLAALERMDAVPLDDLDVVLATQPPTYLARHHALVALTFHQARVFHDLADEYAASGYVDPAIHELACREVRLLDRARIAGVHTWLTGSEEVAGRLATSWDITGTTPFRATPETVADPMALDVYDPGGPVVCVSRHEWPKRTELAVQAGHLLPGVTTELVGGGSRLDWIRDLDCRMARDAGFARDALPSDTWRTTGRGPMIGTSESTGHSPLVIHGETDDAVRDDAYGRAGVVLAPALREDYGLTVLEAFCRARPVIVCRDGGGLVELVGDTGAGLVVDPDAAAIAAAATALRDDPDRARAMAAAALAAATEVTGRDDLAPLVGALDAAGG